MKKLKLTKGVLIILITLFLVVVGAIIVGIVSNNNTLAYSVGQDCTLTEGCYGYLILESYDNDSHSLKCAHCEAIAQINDCTWSADIASAFSNGDETHDWYARCTVCYGVKSTSYSSGVCSDGNSDEKCDLCGGWTDNTGSSGGGTGGGDTGGGSTGGSCTCNGSTSYDSDYRKKDSTLHSRYYVCNVCGGEWYDADYVHNYSNYTDNGDGTHTSDCEQNCGASKTEECSFSNGVCKKCGAEEECDHVEVTIPAVEATCTTAGSTEGTKCSVCGEILEEPTEIEALGHTEETIPGVEATCTTKGSTEGTKCSVCGEILEEQTEIAALGHTEETIPAVEATCTTKGSTEGKKCPVCGVVLQQPTEVPATGHNYEDGTCTDCGEKEPIEEIEITSTKYKIDGGYILDVQPETKASELKTNINTNATEIKIYEKDEEISDNTTIKTGMTIELKNGELTKTFIIIVKGDVNSDGLADFKDLVKMNKARLNKIKLEEIYFLAADVNGDEILDLKDLTKINRFRLNKITEL